MSPHLCISNGQLKLVGPHDAKITVDEFLACQENLQPNRIPVVLTPVVLIPGHEQPYWPLPETDDAIVSDDDQQLFLFYALSARGKVLVLYDGRDLETPLRVRWQVVKADRFCQLPRRRMIAKLYGDVHGARYAMYPHDAVEVQVKVGRWRGYMVHGQDLGDREAERDYLTPGSTLVSEMLEAPVFGDAVANPTGPLCDIVTADLRKRFTTSFRNAHVPFPPTVWVTRIVNGRIGPFVTVIIKDCWPSGIVEGAADTWDRVTGIVVLGTQLLHSEVTRNARIVAARESS